MLNLVIVEDEANIRDCLVHLFPWDSLNVNVVQSCANAQDAYQYISTHPVDLMITDIRLPGISGLDLVRLLRESDIRIPVIVLTGYKHFDYMQQAIRYHVNDFLLKPIKYEELTASILRIRDEIAAGKPAASAPLPAEDDSPYYKQIVNSAMKYIRQNLSSATLESTAIHMNLSAGYFSKIFHKEAGKTFSDYLLEQKMLRAKELLRTPSYKMYEIALMVGYDNPKNFTRAFHSVFGISPTEYRKRGTMQNDPIE